MNQGVTLHNVSRETFDLARELADEHQDPLQQYMDQLLWWNEKVNLVSRDVSRETLHEHLVHSLMPAALKLMEGIQSWIDRSEEHTSELQTRGHLVCRLLLE